MNEWRKVKLGDVVYINQNNFSKEDKWEYINYLDTANITDGIIENIQKLNLEKDTIPSRARRKVLKEDIIISSVRPNLKHFGIIKNPKENMIVSTGFIVLTTIKNVINPYYLYNFFRKENIIEYLSSIAETSTTTYPSITSKVIEELEIKLPSLNIQEKTVKILSDIDEKIELNNKINDNLEKQAQLIFKSWFLDFEPFKNEQPLNWFYTSLGNIADISSGKRPIIKKEIISKEYTIPLIGASNLMGYTNKILYNEPILVIGRVGTLGTVQRINTPCWTSDNTLIIRSEFYEYIFQILRNINYENLNRGSTQPLITQNDLKNIQILLPDLSILKQFENNVGYLMKLYNKNILENNFLNKLKNCLLPKLMNGEIDIEKIEL